MPMRAIAARPGWTLVTIVWLPLQSILTDGVSQHPDAPDLRFEQVAGLHEFRRRAGEADALRRPGREDVAGLERHPGGKIGDEARHLEIHVTRVRFLLDHA